MLEEWLAELRFHRTSGARSIAAPVVLSTVLQCFQSFQCDLCVGRRHEQMIVVESGNNVAWNCEVRECNRNRRSESDPVER